MVLYTTPSSQFDLLAGMLHQAKKIAAAPKPVLFIGAGASLSSGAGSMNSIVSGVLNQLSSGLNLSIMSEEAKLDEFYNLLGQLTDSQRYAVLYPHIGNLEPSKGYLLLAQLVLDGYFDCVLTTNFDVLIEDALMERLLAADRSTSEFEPLVVKVHQPEIIAHSLRRHQPRIKVYKLHGDIRHQAFMFTPFEITQFGGPVEATLKQILSNDLVMVGYSLRDLDVLRCIESTGGNFWYINPTAPTDPMIKGLLETRNSIKIVISGKNGEFETFFAKLFTRIKHLEGDGDDTQEAPQNSQPAQPSVDPGEPPIDLSHRSSDAQTHERKHKSPEIGGQQGSKTSPLIVSNALLIGALIILFFLVPKIIFGNDWELCTAIEGTLFVVLFALLSPGGDEQVSGAVKKRLNSMTLFAIVSAVIIIHLLSLSLGRISIGRKAIGSVAQILDMTPQCSYREASCTPTSTATATVATPGTPEGLVEVNKLVYLGPGQVYPMISTLAPNDVVTVIGINDSEDWYYILLSDDTYGWIRTGSVEFRGDRSLLRIIPLPTNTPTDTPTITPTSVIVLAEIKVSLNVMSEIMGGTAITRLTRFDSPVRIIHQVQANNSTWLEVDIPDGRGWIPYNPDWITIIGSLDIVPAWTVTPTLTPTPSPTPTETPSNTPTASLPCCDATSTNTVTESPSVTPTPIVNDTIACGQRWCMRHLVTNEAFLAFLAFIGSDLRATYEVSDLGDYASVRWMEAVPYCDYYADLIGLAPSQVGLPTRAELTQAGLPLSDLSEFDTQEPNNSRIDYRYFRCALTLP